MQKSSKSVAPFGRRVRGRDVFRSLFISEGGNSPHPYEIIINGWEPGLNKISLTDAFVEFAHIPVADAKKLVDRILEGEKVKLKISDYVQPERLISLLKEIGAVATSDQVRDPYY